MTSLFRPISSYHHNGYLDKNAIRFSSPLSSQGVIYDAFAKT